MTLLVSILALAAVGLALVGAYVLGRCVQYAQDAPVMRRARAEGEALHRTLPHDGPYDLEMRGVHRRA